LVLQWEKSLVQEFLLPRNVEAVGLAKVRIMEKVVGRFMWSIKRSHLQPPGDHKASQTEEGIRHESGRVADAVIGDRVYTSSAPGL
jgi:hypothetical protein